MKLKTAKEKPQIKLKKKYGNMCHNAGVNNV